MDKNHFGTNKISFSAMVNVMYRLYATLKNKRIIYSSHQNSVQCLLLEV
jgi:hypothetical protein